MIDKLQEKVILSRGLESQESILVEVAVVDILRSTGLSKTFELNEAIPVTGLQVVGPLSASIKVTNAGERVLVVGDLRATVMLSCDRCAEEFKLNLHTKIDDYFVHADSEEAGSPEQQIIDGILTYQDDKIVLDELFRQELQTAIPMQSMCSQDCKGLCAGCGKNLNTETCCCENEPVDPRWAGLLELGKADAASAKKSQGKQKRP